MGGFTLQLNLNCIFKLIVMISNALTLSHHKIRYWTKMLLFVTWPWPYQPLFRQIKNLHGIKAKLLFAFNP